MYYVYIILYVYYRKARSVWSSIFVVERIEQYILPSFNKRLETKRK